MPSSSTLLESVADITSMHDRDALSISMCLSLCELFDLARLVFYHCQPVLPAEGDGWIVGSFIRYETGGQLKMSRTPADYHYTPSSSPELDPVLRQALTHADRLALSADRIRLVYCLKLGGRVRALLECFGHTPFSRHDQRMIMGMGRIYENHITLLEYGETDTLTGLLNRKTLERQFAKIMDSQKALLSQIVPAQTALAKAERRDDPEESGYFIAVMDIDHFKRINDQFGHVYGDEVLLLIAQLMRQSFRSNDLLFRFGGEEFVLLIGPQSMPHATQAVERFRETVANHPFPQVGQVTISIGFARLAPPEPLSAVLGRADDALYRAKHGGRNQTVIADLPASQEKERIVSGSIEFF